MGGKDRQIEELRIRHRTYAKTIDGVVLVARTLIRTAGVVGACYCLYLAIDAAAGKNTTFAALVDAALRVDLGKWAAWLVATISTGGWYVTNRVRKKTIKQISGYVTELERKVDPGRTSSRLLPDGSTRKEDRRAGF